jgi:pimeloyl-ACP methyl ester carboxylesterase
MKHNSFRLMICGALLALAACAAQTTPTPSLPPTMPPVRLPAATESAVPSDTKAETLQPRIEEITFQSGEFTLVGDLQLPAGTGPFPVVLFVHGSGEADRTGGIYYLAIMERMLRAGYATFAWDKPGTGESSGNLNPFHVISERAQILLDAIEVVKARPDINPHRIGLWGISQAGYVMPYALRQSDDIAFMICISCAGMSGEDQTTYQAMAMALCSGTPQDQTERRTELLAELDAARAYDTYEEYVHYREVIDALFSTVSDEPQINRFGIIPEQAWLENNPRFEGWWNPIEGIEQLTIPVLAIFGDKDPQIDPIQGAHAYREALEIAGNPRSRVELFHVANHGIVLSETGCPPDEIQSEDENQKYEQYVRSLGYQSLDEAVELIQENPYGPESLEILRILPYAPGYLDLIEEWLRDLPGSYARR